MKFDTYIPCDELKPFIRHFVISETTEESIFKVLPDTGLVIGFQYRGRLSYLQDGDVIGLSTAGITGLQDQYRNFKTTPDIGTVLVFFKEGGAASFFREPLHELFRESVSLDNFMLRSELLLLEERLCETEPDADKIKVVEAFLITRIRPMQPDPLVLGAISLIYKSKGNIRIADLARELYTSQSPLEKKFRQMIGSSPKKFASIVRLKHLLNSYDPQNSLTALGYEAGFYDQAHFIKEFRKFTGETPDNFFSTR